MKLLFGWDGVVRRYVKDDGLGLIGAPTEDGIVLIRVADIPSAQITDGGTRC